MVSNVVVKGTVGLKKKNNLLTTYTKKLAVLIFLYLNQINLCALFSGKCSQCEFEHHFT